MNKSEVAMRTELKFYLSCADAKMLEHRLASVMQMDAFSQKEGSYLIRSLYFDDPSNRAYWEKDAGLSHRHKFRLRYYNDDPSFVRLEKKERFSSLNRKTGVVVTPDIIHGFLHTDAIVDQPSDQPLILELNRRITSESYRPVVFVSYRRIAFCYPAGNVRITLDSHLTASPYQGSFFDTPFPTVPVLNPKEQILEVKYDSFLPPHLADLLRDVPKVCQSISKYCLCREIFL